jgi:hypothetical protein
MVMRSLSRAMWLSQEQEGDSQNLNVGEICVAYALRYIYGGLLLQTEDKRHW